MIFWKRAPVCLISLLKICDRVLKNENRKTELNECHRHLVDALREGDREKGLQALKWHFEMIDEVLG